MRGVREFKSAKPRSGRGVSPTPDRRASRGPERGRRPGAGNARLKRRLPEIKTRCLTRATREELQALVREGGAQDVASWLGCSKRSVDRWLVGAAGMGPSTRRLVRLLAWLLGEGVDLVALVQRDPAALERLATHAEDGDEPELGLDGEPVLLARARLTVGQ